ncbi:inner membrane protein YgaZ [bacterium BMS3Bbin02]|nr:inner membrane protein YgaZ [bacterium BMS3Bbin02]
MTNDRPLIKRAAKDTIPLLVGALPFGVLMGLTIVEAEPVNDFVGWLSSALIFAGAAQIAMTSLLGAGGSVLLVIAVGLVINARHMMYSAALTPRFRTQPRWFRVLAPYWLIDQVFALIDTQVDDTMSDRDFRVYWLTIALTFYGMWHAFVTAGMFLGPIIPESWPVEFGVPAMFIGIVVPALKTRPAAVAAVVGAFVGAAASTLPLGLGLLVGGLVGIVAGTVADRRIRV